MNVFKLAVTIIARHWSYLLIYTLALGCMAILGSGAIEAPQASEFSNDAPKVAVVDRDGSELSAALKDFALKDAVEVHVEDSTFALQDAAAKDLASYVLIIPEGFQEGLVEAAHSGADAPTLETVVSYQGARGALMDQRVKAYVQSLYGFASVDAQASARDVANNATAACGDETPVELFSVDSEGLSVKYINFAAFSAYALFTSSAIFIAVGLASLRKTEMRRRLVVGPVRELWRAGGTRVCARFAGNLGGHCCGGSRGVQASRRRSCACLGRDCGVRAARRSAYRRRVRVPAVAAWGERKRGERRRQHRRFGVQLFQRRMDSPLDCGRGCARGRGVHPILLGDQCDDRGLAGSPNHVGVGSSGGGGGWRHVLMGARNCDYCRRNWTRAPA